MNDTSKAMPFVRNASRNLCDNFLMQDRYTLNPSQIVMYTTQQCPDCRRVKAFLEARRIPFHQVSLEEDEQAAKFVARLNRGFHSVPTIIFPDGSILVEPSWEELKAKFN